ncbi:hypothetical protein Bbelb_264580 [Branchiostoma belcheri]|nr:hypothetical protein Bbelb_264580 [Branchiostoma belcheri]
MSTICDVYTVHTELTNTITPRYCQACTTNARTPRPGCILQSNGYFGAASTGNEAVRTGRGNSRTDSGKGAQTERHFGSHQVKAIDPSAFHIFIVLGMFVTAEAPGKSTSAKDLRASAIKDLLFGNFSGNPELSSAMTPAPLNAIIMCQNLINVFVTSYLSSPELPGWNHAEVRSTDQFTACPTAEVEPNYRFSRGGGNEGVTADGDGPCVSPGNPRRAELTIDLKQAGSLLPGIVWPTAPAVERRHQMYGSDPVIDDRSKREEAARLFIWIPRCSGTNPATQLPLVPGEWRLP